MKKLIVAASALTAMTLTAIPAMVDWSPEGPIKL